MNWQELQQKHFDEWKEFEKLKTQAWDKMNEKHVEMKQVFKNDPNRMPPESLALIKAEKEKWSNDWGKDGYKRLHLMYGQQRDSERLIDQQARDRLVFELNDRRQQEKEKQNDQGR